MDKEQLIAELRHYAKYSPQDRQLTAAADALEAAQLANAALQVKLNEALNQTEAAQVRLKLMTAERDTLARNIEALEFERAKLPHVLANGVTV